MFKSIATWALVASSAAVVIAGPVPEVDARDLAEPMPLLARSFGSEAIELEAREPEDIEMEARDIEARAGKTISAIATFDNLLAGGDTRREIGNYGALQWQAISE